MVGICLNATAFLFWNGEISDLPHLHRQIFLYMAGPKCYLIDVVLMGLWSWPAPLFCYWTPTIKNPVQVLLGLVNLMLRKNQVLACLDL
jgi:hypothetical protein